MRSVASEDMAVSSPANQAGETVMLIKPGPASSSFSMNGGWLSFSLANTASAIFRGGCRSVLAAASASLHWKSPNFASVAGSARTCEKSFSGNAAENPSLSQLSIDLSSMGNIISYSDFRIDPARIFW